MEKDDLDNRIKDLSDRIDRLQYKLIASIENEKRFNVLQVFNNIEQNNKEQAE